MDMLGGEDGADKGDAAFVMTSWHDGESPDDVVRFSARDTNFDSHDFRRKYAIG